MPCPQQTLRSKEALTHLVKALFQLEALPVPEADQRLHVQEGKDFRVVVVDGRPHMQGRKLLQQLLRAGVPATYCLLNALTYVMQARLLAALLLCQSNCYGHQCNACFLSAVGQCLCTMCLAEDAGQIRPFAA